MKRWTLLRLLLWVLGLASLASSLACAESLRYRYVSIENVPGINTTKIGASDLRHPHLLGGEFPIEYELRRPSYRLVFWIATDRFAPHIWIRPTVEPAQALLLKPRPDLLPPTTRARPCGTYSTPRATEELRFDWVICGVDASPEEMSIAFDVVDTHGEVRGQEVLRFQIHESGFYFPPDGP